VDNVCVYAFPQKAKPIAIVVPDEAALRSMVEKRKIANKTTDLAELTGNKNVKEAVMKDMLSAGKLAGLQGIELISGIILSSNPWTPENVPSIQKKANLRDLSQQQ
jgi:long-chain acyl-CoA synthetase